MGFGIGYVLGTYLIEKFLGSKHSITKYTHTHTQASKETLSLLELLVAAKKCGRIEISPKNCSLLEVEPLSKNWETI